MISLFGGYVLNIVENLVDRWDYYWNAKLCWKVSQAVGLELTLNRLRSYSEKKLFGLEVQKKIILQTEL